MYRLLLIVLFNIAIRPSAFANNNEENAAPADSLKGLLEKKQDVTAPETPAEKKLEKKLQRKLYSAAQFGHETILFNKQYFLFT